MELGPRPALPCPAAFCGTFRYLIEWEGGREGGRDGPSAIRRAAVMAGGSVGRMDGRIRVRFAGETHDAARCTLSFRWQLELFLQFRNFAHDSGTPDE